MTKVIQLLLCTSIVAFSCQEGTVQANIEALTQDSIKQNQEALLKAEEERQKPITAQDIKLSKALTYDKHSLEDNYTYNKKAREFQWDKIKEKLAYIENFQKNNNHYGVISNYKNKNGEAPTVASFSRNEYKRVADTLGTERYQSVPLYTIDHHQTPIIYGRDGSLVNILSDNKDGMIRVQGLSNFEGEWDIPERYVKSIGDTISFKHIVVVDVTNQNICAIEHLGDQWIIRSMNPATTGRHNPPYGMKTPVGIFVLQEQKPKMFYLKDGTSTIQGYAPWASRFTNGAYIHGVPTSDPKAPIIEYSATLGTIPRSHMCVRNASSHSKFIYDWTKPLSSLVIVID